MSSRRPGLVPGVLLALGLAACDAASAPPCEGGRCDELPAPADRCPAVAGWLADLREAEAEDPNDRVWIAAPEPDAAGDPAATTLPAVDDDAFDDDRPGTAFAAFDRPGDVDRFAAPIRDVRQLGADAFAPRIAIASEGTVTRATLCADLRRADGTARTMGCATLAGPEAHGALRLDAPTTRDDDGGVLEVVVTGPAEDACATYTLTYAGWAP